MVLSLQCTNHVNAVGTCHVRSSLNPVDEKLEQSVFVVFSDRALRTRDAKKYAWIGRVGFKHVDGDFGPSLVSHRYSGLINGMRFPMPLEPGRELIDVGPDRMSLLYAFGFGTLIRVAIPGFPGELTLVAIQ